MKKSFASVFKKTFILLLSAVLLICSLSFFVGCEKEVVHITLKVPRGGINCIVNPEYDSAADLLTAAGNKFSESYATPVEIEVVEFESGGETKAVTNTFGTDTAADILFDSFYNMSAYIHMGYAVPLDGLLSETALADLGSKYVDGGRVNGRQYMMPYKLSVNVLIYNKDLLKSCGLERFIPDDNETITNWTLDEWTEILDTLAERLPAGYVPTMMYAKDNDGDTHIMTMLRAFGSEIIDSNGNFKFDDKAVEALRWLQGGVAKGWYLSVPYDKTFTDNNSKFRTGEMAFFNFNSAGPMYNSIIKDGGLNTYGFVNYPGNSCTYFTEGFEVFDNGDPEKIAIAKDFVKYFYETDEWLECSAGSIPVSSKVLQKYYNDIPLLDMFSRNVGNEIDFRKNLPNWQGLDNSVRSVFYQDIAKLLLRDTNGDFVYTPEEIGNMLEEKLNKAIRYGWTNSHPHA